MAVRRCETCGAIRNQEHLELVRHARVLTKLINAVGWSRIDELIDAFRTGSPAR